MIMVFNVRVLVAFVIASVSVTCTATLSFPLGFVRKGNTCVCAGWPNGMVTCNEESLTASMAIGYCMTYDNETNKVRAGGCVQTFYRNDSHKLFYPLPTEEADLDDYMCGPSNTKGLLCGECQDGFGIPPLGGANCINCTSVSSGWIKFFAAAYLPDTIIFTIIILFAISVVSGPVNSLIFFGQITSSQLLGICFTLEAHLSHLNRSSSVRNIVSALYDTWNLNFSAPSYLHFV